MVRKLVHHWLNPQTIPRGFLRMYILMLLSRGDETGYSIIQKINERTEGTWRPGAGTIYPLLKGLRDEGLVKVSHTDGKGRTKAYGLASRGRREIDRKRRLFASAGKREPVMSRLISELLPGDVLVPLMIRRYRDGAEVLRQKLAEVPDSEREILLKELRLLMESQIRWIDAQLRSTIRTRVTSG